MILFSNCSNGFLQTEPATPQLSLQTLLNGIHWSKRCAKLKPRRDLKEAKLIRGEPCLLFGGTRGHGGYPVWAPPSHFFKKGFFNINRSIVFFWNSALNQDCKPEPVIAKSSLWRQSHKPVSAKPQTCDCKSQKGWCECSSKVFNYSIRMIVVRVEPTEPYGGIPVGGLSESKLCVGF